LDLACPSKVQVLKVGGQPVVLLGGSGTFRRWVYWKKERLGYALEGDIPSLSLSLLASSTVSY
jgi:hypothetical protein